MTELPPQGPQFRKDERADEESETPDEQPVESDG